MDVRQSLSSCYVEILTLGSLILILKVIVWNIYKVMKNKHHPNIKELLKVTIAKSIQEYPNIHKHQLISAWWRFLFLAYKVTQAERGFKQYTFHLCF